MTTTLDPFETALLARLRDVVAEGAAEPVAARRRRRTTLRLLAAAAGLAVGAVAVPGLLANPAYSVSEGNDGRVKVSVHRLDDAAGLREALAAYGIRADVTFLADGLECAPGRYVPVERRGMLVSVGSDRFSVTLAPGTVRDGETFVIAASVVPLGNGVRAWVDFGVTSGPVTACREVPARP
jgi:hypothetical protein